MDKNNALMGVGIGGTVLAAICCMTTLPVLFLGAIGLSALTGSLDYVLIPALLLFAGLTAYASYRRRKAQDCCVADDARLD